MKVYIMKERYSDGYETIGEKILVFSSLEKAQAYIKAKEPDYTPDKASCRYTREFMENNLFPRYLDYNVVELTLDEEEPA